MPSVSSKPVRRAPKQPRSERTLEAIFEVSAKLILENGVDALTMTEIAYRADLSIGGLYHYFPDKRSVVVALLSQYGTELEQMWQPLLEQAPKLKNHEFAEFFIETVIEFVRQRPAFLTLVSSPIRFRGTPEARRSLRNAVAAAFRSHKPSLSEQEAFLAGNVTIQLLRGLMHLLGELLPADHEQVAKTYRDLLTHYVESVLR
ncbi:MAG: TetR/AcrR family transcriptional regulator [Acidobacteriaceae bacterium]|nr:TetR/AcrR family transcriptional regulator [Acidobacteriaceae bacterium]